MPSSNPATPGPTLTLGLMNFAASAPSDGWSGLVDRARAADEAGIDRILVVDHVVMGEHLEAYDGGKFPTGPDGVWLEPLTLLSVLAGVTSRVRLGTGILIAPLRRPVVLAKALATLDVLSNGRVDLGVGVGWQREEYEAAGLPFEERGRLLDETLEVCRTLWRDSPASYTSGRLKFESIWCEPKPLQPGGVPIWVAGTLNPGTLRRVVRFGDGWIPWGEYIRDVERGIREVREALSAAGRDAAGFGVRGTLVTARLADGTPDVAKTMDVVPGLVAGGVTDFNLVVRLPDHTEAATEVLSTLVGAFHETVGRVP
jgi:probable F420-dependent oxidoreductase